VRGGSFVFNLGYVRSAYRSHNSVDYRNVNVGFRVVAPGS
jgi:formylglycine-generating enzyme required for sulfatase activity